MSQSFNRRDFLRIAGVTGLGAVGAANVFAGNGRDFQQDGAVEPTPAPTSVADPTAEDYKTMDAHHQERVDIYLNNVGKQPNFWGEKLPFEMDGDVKVFNLVCQDIDWEVEPGVIARAMAYNGIVPGPEMRLTEGDKVRVIVKNEMAQSTAVHWHGLRVPNNVDGVPMVTQPVIAPGETYTYEFTVRNSGTHMYHSHHNAAEQVTRGLFAALIVDPKDTSREPKIDADYNFVLNDSGLGNFTFNGRSFPYTQPIVAKLGDKIRIRYFNEGLMIHPMHLHGLPQLVFAKDGYYLPQPYMCDTLNIAPGERYDVLVDCDDPGFWAFHCHVLTHAESAAGMFGMVTVLIVQDESAT